MLAFFTSAWIVLCQLGPWLLVGMLISGMMHVLLPAGFIHRKLRGPGGVVKAVVLGVPLPLCSCGVVPAGIGLKREGASHGAAIGFLISTPQTGVDSVLVSASFLGWPFALFKVFSATVTGIVGGLITETVEVSPDKEGAGTGANGKQANAGLWAMCDHALEILRSIWGWLVIGVLVSATIETYLPHTLLPKIAAWGSVSAALVALSLSLPLYVCAVASVPIAATLVSNGLPPGAALVFLMAGPATNLATLGAVHRTFGLRTVSIYLGTIVFGSIGFAAVFDWLLVDVHAGASAHHHGHSVWWEQAAAVLLLGFVGWFAFDDLKRWWVGNRTPGETGVPGFKVAVTGMTCNACVHRLERGLHSTPGIDSAVVHLDPGQAIVHGPIDEPGLRRAIVESGFQVEKVVAI